MSELYIHNRSPPTGSGPIFIFHGEVQGFTYSANPQGDLVSCMMVNSATSTPTSGTPWSESLRQYRRHNTSHAQPSGTASQTTESNDPSVYTPQPLVSSFEGNQDTESITSLHSTPTVYYNFGLSRGVEGAPITSNRASSLPTRDPTNLIDGSKEFLRFLFDMFRRVFLSEEFRANLTCLSEVTEDLHRTLEKSGKYIQNSVQENLINTHELPGLQMGPNDRALVNFEFDEG